MSAENVELAQQIAAQIASDDFVAALRDEDGIEARMSALQPLALPDFEVEMIGPEYAATEPVIHRGVQGYLELWRDWLAPYESYRAELEEFIDAGDNVVMFVRQVARTTTGGPPIETESAVVFTFRAGKLARLEFHLDRERAMKAAGLAEEEH